MHPPASLREDARLHPLWHLPHAAHPLLGYGAVQLRGAASAAPERELLVSSAETASSRACLPQPTA